MNFPAIRNVIESGQRADWKVAKKTMDKLVMDKDRRAELVVFMQEILELIPRLVEVPRMVAAAGIIRLLVWFEGHECYQLLRETIVFLLQNPDGRARQAGVNLAEYVGMGMTLSHRTAWRLVSGHTLNMDQAIADFATALFDLAERFNFQRGRHKCINTLPPCELKSIHFAIDHFRRSRPVTYSLYSQGIIKLAPDEAEELLGVMDKLRREPRFAE